MKIIDAISVLELTPPIDSFEQIKQAYKRMIQKYHPDRNAAGLHIAQAINAAYLFLKELNKEGKLDSYFTRMAEEFQENKKQGNPGIAEVLSVAINKIIHIPGITIEVCGIWVWVSGDTKPIKDQLKQAGFLWHSKKGMWYFRPEESKYRRSKGFDMETIRMRYGSTTLRPEELKELSA